MLGPYVGRRVCPAVLDAAGRRVLCCDVPATITTINLCQRPLTSQQTRLQSTHLHDNATHRPIAVLESRLVDWMLVTDSDLPTLASSSFHARGQVTATVVSPFMVPSCGTLCHMTCGQLTYLWPHSEIDWKHSCLTLTRSSAFAALANLGYTSDIIIIIIIT